jgi:hypothetical protein
MNQTAPQHPPGAGKLKQGKQGGGRRRRARSPALPVAWDSEARIGEGGSSSSGGGICWVRKEEEASGWGRVESNVAAGKVRFR